MAYEKSCCLSEGFLAYPMMRDPKTDPIPAPDPATPTVAAPAPMNLAAESMSDLGAEVCMACTAVGRMARMAAMERRGETAIRAMADIVVVTVRWSRSEINRSCIIDCVDGWSSQVRSHG